MVFPYLSTTPPENAGIHSGVRQLTGSMGRYTPPWFSPSRPGCPGTEVSSCCGGSRLYAGSCPALTGRLPLGSLGSSWRSPLMWLLVTGLYLKNVYSVVKEHLARRPRNNSVVTGNSLFEKGLFYRDARRPVLPKNRPLYDPFDHFRLFMTSERIIWASESCFWICKVSKDRPVSR